MEAYTRKVFEVQSPCDKCDQLQDCKENELACRAFSYFVLRGTFQEYTARLPTKELFDRIFKDDDKALQNYLKSLKAKE